MAPLLLDGKSCSFQVFIIKKRNLSKKRGSPGRMMMMYKNFKSKAGFSKMDKNKCPFLKTGGRLLKKTSTSSLRA
jgi:hypothetical protein